MFDLLHGWLFARRWRIYAALVLLSVLPLLLFLSTADRFLRRRVTTELLTQTGPVADQAASTMEKRLADAKDSLKSIAADPSLLAAWTQGDQRTLAARLRQAHGLKRNVRALAIYDLQGSLRTHDPESEPLASDASSLEWFRAALRPGGEFVSGLAPAFSGSSESAITVAVPLNPDRPAGIIAVTYSAQTLRDWMSDISRNDSRWISVVDQKGTVVAGRELGSPDGHHNAGDREEVRKVLAGRSGALYMSVEGRPVLVHLHPIPSVGWGVLVEIPNEELDKAIWKFERPLALLGVVFVIFAVGIGGTGAWLYTERKRALERIQHLNAELQDRISELEARNRELDAFSYSVSHDVQAPLRHIEGFAKLLREECGQMMTPTGREFLEQIRNGALRMRQLVDGLLRISRLGEQGLKLQVTDLEELVREVVSGLQRDLGDRKVTFEIGHLPPVECDHALVRQVFWNLLSNAVKFTSTREHATIEVGQSGDGNGGVLFVRDNGVGFNMKYADKLFGLFQRLHRQDEFEGTGVGLATTQRIILKHKGRIWADAEPEHGASFFFSLSPPGREAQL